MNGEPLPLEHGFPARLVVPGLYGYVERDEVAAQDRVDDVGRRGGLLGAAWLGAGRAHQDAVTHRRAARRRARSPRGRRRSPGSPGRSTAGVDKVEVRIDEGRGRRRGWATDVTDDTWRQWVLDWDADAGPAHDPGARHRQRRRHADRRRPRPTRTARRAITPARSRSARLPRA